MRKKLVRPKSLWDRELFQSSKGGGFLFARLGTLSTAEKRRRNKSRSAMKITVRLVFTVRVLFARRLPPSIHSLGLNVCVWPIYLGSWKD